MLMNPVGLRSEKGCAGDARQKLKSTDPTSHQRGRTTSTNPKLLKKIIKERMGKINRGSQIPTLTGRLAVDRNITLNLTLTHYLYTSHLSSFTKPAIIELHLNLREINFHVTNLSPRIAFMEGSYSFLKTKRCIRSNRHSCGFRTVAMYQRLKVHVVLTRLYTGVRGFESRSGQG
jgi:hypothetical protein